MEKKGRFILIGLLIVLAGFAAVMILRNVQSHSSHDGSKSGKVVYYCPMHPNYKTDHPGTCPICNMSLVKLETAPSAKASSESPAAKPAPAGAEPRVFTIQELLKMKPREICLLHKCKMGNCVMAMTEEFARLGKCPHCGEDLGIVIKELTPQGYGKVELSPEKQKIVGVKTSPAKKMPLSKVIRTVGRIAYDPALYQAEEEYLQALKSFQKANQGNIPEIKDQAARLVDSVKIKLKLLGLNNELIREVEKAGKPDRSLLYSDAGGKVWLYAPIYEYEIPLVKVGQTVEAEISGLPGKKFSGKVMAIDPVLDPATRSVRIRAILDNAEGALKPEMFANATLKTDLGEVLAVPEEAVFMTGDKNIIFVAKPGGAFEPREVGLGIKSEGVQQITSGLSEGENVVVSGNFLIDSESRLKAAFATMEEGGGHSHGA